MFKKSKILLTAVLFMLFVSSPAITQLDSCWKLCGPHDPENGFYNPDSIMVDTCVVPNRNYAKKWYYNASYGK
jgi:hypothetical protein